MNKNTLELTNITIASYYYKFIAYLEKYLVDNDNVYDYEVINDTVDDKEFFNLVCYVNPSYSYEFKKYYDMVNDKFYNNMGNVFFTEKVLVEVNK